VPADSDLPISKVLREYDRPEIRVERAEYGMRLQTLRKISDAQTAYPRHQHPLPAGLRHPDERGDDHHAVARAGRR
jgi:hypothetical protein